MVDACGVEVVVKIFSLNVNLGIISKNTLYIIVNWNILQMINQIQCTVPEEFQTYVLDTLKSLGSPSKYMIDIYGILSFVHF